MFHQSKTPVAKPLKQTSMVNFLSCPDQAALAAAPSPTSSKVSSQAPGVASCSALKKKKAINSPKPPAPSPEAHNASLATPQAVTPSASRAVTPAASLPWASRSTTRTRKHKTRVRVKLTVDTLAEQSPNPPTMAKLKLLYLAQKDEDKTVIWLAWALAEENQCLSITSEADFPYDIEGFRRYTDRLRPRGGRAVLWIVLLIACNGNPNNMTSTVTSTMNWWHKDNHSACHLYDIQDSDDAMEVGTLAFSGVHCDHFRLT